MCVCVERVLTKDAGNESENKLERYEKRVQNFVDDDDGSKKQERKVADREIKRGVCVCVLMEREDIIQRKGSSIQTEPFLSLYRA